MTAISDSEQQPYDNLLKRLLEGQATAILPLLLAGNQPDLKVIEELNIEVLLPPRRTDRIYRSSICGRPAIVHVEFETSSNTQMDKRLLVYHALLHEKHKLPVHSVIVYPFKTSMVCSPYRESDGPRDIVTFHYQTVPLWKMDARRYVEQRAFPLYGLLPTMDGTDKTLLLQALEEMIEHYGTSETRLREELLCFQVLLQRAHRLPEQDLHSVLERIHMLDPLLEQDPWIQGLQSAALTKGELKSARDLLLQIVGKRFPKLARTAEAQTAHLEDAEVLKGLVVQVSLCADEQAVLNALQAVCAS